MQEKWRAITECPKYNVSNLGRIENGHTGRILRPTTNQQGLFKVNLANRGQFLTRSVSMLVARAFLPPPERSDFISTIHLNGDRADSRAVNLAWRPRYFAIRYHQQFNHPQWRTLKTPVIDTKAGVVYETVQEAALAHGLVFTEILVAAQNRTFVWPTYQEFRVMS